MNREGSIGLLHLTDFHQGMGGQPTLWPNVKESFLDDLELLHERAGPWDVIVFTGDLTQRGTRAEFDALDRVLEGITARLKPLGSEPLLFAVPGNHDLSRPTDSGALQRLTNWHKDPEVPKSFFEDASTPERRLVSEAFSEYSRWWNSKTATAGLTISHGVLPGDFAATVEKNGLRLALVGLNSAFLHLRDGMQDGELHVDPRQLLALNADPPEWLRGHHGALLLTHHPVGWLHQKSQANFRAEIELPGRFVAHLCGHMHEPAAVVLSQGGAKPRRTLQGLSLFGLETFSNSTGEAEHRLHGYAALRISVQGNQGELLVWPRSYEMNQGAGHRRMIPDYGRYELSHEAVMLAFAPRLPFTITPQVDQPDADTTAVASSSNHAAPESQMVAAPQRRNRKWILLAGAFVVAAALGASALAYDRHQRVVAAKSLLGAARRESDAHEYQNAATIYAEAGAAAGRLALDLQQAESACERGGVLLQTHRQDEAEAEFLSCESISKRMKHQALVGKAIIGRAHCAQLGGDSAKAVELYEMALPIVVAADDDVALSNLHRLYGSLELTRGHSGAARQHFAEALSACERWSKQGSCSATIHYGLGDLAKRVGDTIGARQEYTTTLAMGEAANDRYVSAMALLRLGELSLLDADADTAATQYSRALGLSRAVGDKNGEAYAWLNLGNLGVWTGDRALGRRDFDTAEKLFLETQDLIGRASLLYEKGQLEREEYKLEDAATAYQGARDLYKAAGNRGGEALSLRGLGDLELLLGRVDVAGSYYRDALKIYQEIGSTAGLTESFVGMGYLSMQLGDPLRARDYYAMAMGQLSNVSSSQFSFVIAEGLATAELQLGNPSVAVEKLLPAIDGFEKSGDKRGEASARRKLGDALQSLGRKGEAREMYRFAYGLFVRIGDVPGSKSIQERLQRLDPVR